MYILFSLFCEYILFNHAVDNSVDCYCKKVIEDS